MTNEEVIRNVKTAFEWWEDNARMEEDEDWNRQHEALDIAIKALEQQPCEDCISLNKLDDIITKAIDDSENQTECQTLRWVLDVMSELPSVTPSYNSIKSELKPCEDCISRKDVIILIDEATELHPYKVIGDSETYSNYNQGWEDACNWLYANVESDNLKTVTPQKKSTGSWVEKQVVDNEEVEIEQWQSARCSKCDKYHTTPYSYYFDDYNYCPNCGAKMEVEDGSD